MTKTYIEMKKEHQEKINNFPFIVAFTEAGFKKAMVNAGLTEKDTDKIISIGGGMYIKKDDKQAYLDMCDVVEKEEKEMMNDPIHGEEFMRQMCRYELNNHEYGYTYELEDTISAMGYTFESIQENGKLYAILLEEAKKIRETEEV